MPNYENIKPHQWKKGQSGNPKGRPKKKRFEDFVRDILEEKIDGDTTKLELMARTFVDRIIKGHPRMVAEYLQREWPAIQKAELRHMVNIPKAQQMIAKGFHEILQFVPKGQRTEALNAAFQAIGQPIEIPESIEEEATH